MDKDRDVQETEFYKEITEKLEEISKTLDSSLSEAQSMAEGNTPEAVNQLAKSHEALREMLGIFGVLMKKEMDDQMMYVSSCATEIHILSEILIRKGLTTPEELINMKKALYESAKKEVNNNGQTGLN